MKRFSFSDGQDTGKLMDLSQSSEPLVRWGDILLPDVPICALLTHVLIPFWLKTLFCLQGTHTAMTLFLSPS